MSNRTLALSVPATLSAQSSSGRWTAAAIHIIIDDHQLDVLALQETWMHADSPPCVKSDIAPAHYSVTHVHRNIVSGWSTRGGCLAIVSRDELKVRSHPLANGLKVTSFELQLVKLSSWSTSFVILNIYRSPSNSVPTFLDELADVVSFICAIIERLSAAVRRPELRRSWKFIRRRQPRICTWFPRCRPTRPLTDMGRSHIRCVGNRCSGCCLWGSRWWCWIHLRPWARAGKG